MTSVDPRYSEIISSDRTAIAIAEGFEFTEGPIWHPVDRHLTFSDIPANRLYRYVPGQGVSLYREPSNMANGNTYDRQGRLLSCEHATSRVTREEDGGLTVPAPTSAGAVTTCAPCI